MDTPARLILRKSPVSLVVCFVVCTLFPNCSSSALEAQASSTASSYATWVKFQDPHEHAFTVEIPQGWRVKGGLFRLGYSDFRIMVDLKSPDGKTNIRFGDVGVPTYSLPDRNYTREGQPYDLGLQGQMVIARYRSGRDYATLYAQSRFRNFCQSVTPEPTDSSSPVADKGDHDSDLIQTSTGQVTYRCDTREGVRTAYVYCRTSLHRGYWSVPWIVSFITPSDQVAAVRNIILRSTESVHLNPEWVQHQKELDREGLEYQRRVQQGRMAQMSRQVQQFESQMRSNQNQVNAFERQQEGQRLQVQQFDDALVGVTPTHDPLTGENRRVWTGTKHYQWINGLGQVKDSDTSPGPGWRQLETPQ